MLDVMDLDDRRFEQIVMEAREMIQTISPEWTDENAHDPGITMIELFAWLSEMQQYYLNRISDKNKRKFLKLLGISLRSAVSATTDVDFVLEKHAKELTLLKGTKLIALPQKFETKQELLLIPAKLKTIVVASNGQHKDVTNANMNIHMSYYVFGKEAKKDHCLYIGFDAALPVNKTIALTLRFHDTYPVDFGNKVEDGSGFFPSAKVLWEYSVKSQSGEEHQEWKPLHIIKDETYHMSFTGRLNFQIPSVMESKTIFGQTKYNCFWLRCVLKEEGYELPHKLFEIRTNAISVIHRETLSKVVHEAVPNTLTDRRITLKDYLSYHGKLLLQVKNMEGDWQYWHEVQQLDKTTAKHVFEVSKDLRQKQMEIHFSYDPHWYHKDSIRVIAYMPENYDQYNIGSSNGQANQVWSVNDPSIIPESMRLQVAYAKYDEIEEIVWGDWTRVEDFDNSNPNDRHYVYDVTTNSIRFGDNTYGMIPPIDPGNIIIMNKKVVGNIRLISYQRGGGREGNVSAKWIRTIVENPDEPSDMMSDLSLSNPFPAEGGMDHETILDAEKRINQEFNKIYRAVTNNDYELAAKQIPGVRIARVKAIPLYTREKQNYPEMAQMTIVVVPYSILPKPIPSRGFLQTVHQHLDSKRLITTQLHVIAPQYIEISVTASIYVESFMKERVKPIIAEALHKLVEVDWPFGKKLFKAEIYSIFSEIEGIHFVESLHIITDGKSTENGDVEIPLHGLFYCGEHDISIKVVNHDD